MAERNPRASATREADARPMQWKRQSVIPAPEPRDGWTFRWVRTSSMGAADNMNVSRRFREGYEPVKASEFPELKLMTDLDSRFKDNIEVGGLLLCRAPTELVESRVQGQLNETRAQMEAVDNNYLRGSDPRMPVLQPERSTRQTSFGK